MTGFLVPDSCSGFRHRKLQHGWEEKVRQAIQSGRIAMRVMALLKAWKRSWKQPNLRGRKRMFRYHSVYSDISLSNAAAKPSTSRRSEEHTSELQSRETLVC